MERKEEKRQILQNENEEMVAELELSKKKEDIFHALVETAVGKIGQDFFDSIVIKLSKWLNVDCVIIGQAVGDNIVEGFPLYLDGKIIKGFTYQLTGSPCDLTSKMGYCVYEDNVRHYFPNSKDLKDLKIRGYVGIALYNENGEPNGVLCAMSRNRLELPPQTEEILRIVGQRITSELERIKSQRALEISEEKLKKTNASKDRLFSIIAHDLKNPFNALIGFSDLIKRNIDKHDYEKVNKYSEVIHDISSQTYNFLINLLEWSLSQIRDIKYEPVHLNLADLIEGLISSHNHIAHQKMISLNSFVDSGVIIYADKNMITTIIRNLLSNAIKFTQSGGEVSIKVNIDSGKTIISVSDNGVGIKPEDIGKLFDLDDYYTTNGTSNEKGVGLGLILCKEFVQKHNGEIWVESKPREGAKFYFSIPVSN